MIEKYHQTKTLAARSGTALHLAKGQKIKVINVQGHQVVDTWAFNANDVGEFVSMAHTRAMNNRIYIGEGETLFSNQRRAVLTLEQDTSASRHDTLIAACDRYRYKLLGATGYHDNCTDNLYRAMRDLNLQPPVCPSPLNLWMIIPVDDSGDIQWSEPKLEKDDYVVLRAEMDCIVVMSCCPQDMVNIHGQGAQPADVHYAVSA